MLTLSRKRTRKAQMRAEELISEMIPPLKYSETGEKALNWMNEFRVNHLPVVKGNQYIGLLSENDIYDMPDPALRLDECFLNLPKPFIYLNSHAYEAVSYTHLTLPTICSV